MHIKTLLAGLGVTPAEISVYTSLLAGNKRVSLIMKHTSLKRPTVYYALQRLIERGLAHKTGKQNEGFSANPKDLLAFAGERAKQAKNTETETALWLETFTLAKNDSQETGLQYYRGEQAIKNVISETLYARSKRMWIIAPSDNFFHALGEKFLREYIEERKRRGFSIRSLWDTRTSDDIIKKYYGEQADIRILPPNMHRTFQTTALLFDDTVLYISSKKNAYALRITSKEHYQFLISLFEGLWIISKKH